MIIGVAHRRPDVPARAHGVRPRRHPARAAAPDRPRRRDRHRDRHAPGRGLRDGAAAGRPRAERDRDDEHPRRLRRAGLAGHEGRLQVLAPTTTAASATTRASSPRRCAPARAAHPPGVRHRRGRRRRPGLRRAQPATSRSPRCASATASGRTCTTSHSALLGLPAVPGILGFDPRYQFIHEDDIVGVLHHAAINDLPGIHNAAPDGVLALSRDRRACWASRTRRCCRRGGRRSATARHAAARHPDPRRGRAQQLRYGRGLDNRKFKQSGYRFSLTTRETVQAFAAALRLKPLRESGEAPYRYEREVEEFLRWSPSVRRDESGS